MSKYRVPVMVEVEIDETELDETDEFAGGAAALAAVDETLQRAWDTDQGRKWITTKWHFEIGPDVVVEEVTT